MRSLSSSVVILVGMLVLWAVPAHGQIVSYMDSGGKRVFINAEPATAVRPVKDSAPADRRHRDYAAHNPNVICSVSRNVRR